MVIRPTVLLFARPALIGMSAKLRGSDLAQAKSITSSDRSQRQRSLHMPANGNLVCTASPLLHLSHTRRDAEY